MIYLLAALWGAVCAVAAAMVGGINLPTALLGAMAASLIGWGCAAALDRRRSRR